LESKEVVAVDEEELIVWKAVEKKTKENQMSRFGGCFYLAL